MMVSCRLDATNSRIYFANSVNILSTPVSESGQEIVWVHTLLEFIYYFLPLEQPDVRVFNVLHRALSFTHFSDFFDPEFSVLKKFFLVKLLKLFGFFPDFVITSFPSFEALVFTSVDFPNIGSVKFLKNLIRQVKNEEVELINKWVKRCMARHPNARRFKSVSVSY